MFDNDLLSIASNIATVPAGVRPSNPDGTRTTSISTLLRILRGAIRSVMASINFECHQEILRATRRATSGGIRRVTHFRLRFSLAFSSLSFNTPGSSLKSFPTLSEERPILEQVPATV